MLQRSVPLDPASTRSSITERIGATPVPGPTQIIGVLRSSGNCMSPFCTDMRRLSPEVGGINVVIMTRRIRALTRLKGSKV